MAGALSALQGPPDDEDEDYMIDDTYAEVTPKGGLSSLSEDDVDPDAVPPGAGGLGAPQIDALTSRLRQTSARDAYTQALRGIMNRQPQKGKLDLSLLSLAAGLLTPTQGGTFGEALGQALPGFVKQKQTEEVLDEEHQDKRDAYQLKALESEASDERTNEATLMRLMAQLYGKDGKIVKTDQGVFLRKPDGTMTRLGGLTPREASPNSINMYERESDKLKAQREGKFYDDLIGQGQAAIKQEQNLDNFALMMEQPHLEGAAAPVLNTITSAVQTFGIDPQQFNLPGASAGEVMAGIGAKMVLDQTGGSLGAGISNGDRSFIEAQVPKFGATDKGNVVLSTLMRRINKRKREVMRFANDYEAKHNGSLDGIIDAVDREFSNKSIIDDQLRKDIETAAATKGRVSVGDVLHGASAPQGALITKRFRNGDFGDPKSDAAKAKWREEMAKVGIK